MRLQRLRDLFEEFGGRLLAFDVVALDVREAEQVLQRDRDRRLACPSARQRQRARAKRAEDEED